jgi:general secretion pathway protein G
MFKIKNTAIGALKSKSKGFTLLEVMVVVVIIAIMAAAVGPKLLENINTASKKRAATDIISLEGTLKLYKAENYAYPSTDQGLEALINKPSGDPAPKNWRQYMEKTPKDPWENPYKYLSPGSHGDFDLYSFGPDGIQSEDDITSWSSDN